MAPFWSALQVLLNINAQGALELDIVFNVSKTVCMVFVPYDSRKIMSVSFQYLGHIITCTLSNSIDIDRVIRGLFTRTNSLVRNFAKCSSSVKKILFNTLCASVYGAGQWHSLLRKDKDKIIIIIAIIIIIITSLLQVVLKLPLLLFAVLLTVGPI